MKFYVCFVSLCVGLHSLFSQPTEDTIVAYFFHGQGSDERVFEKIEWPDNYMKVFIRYPIPKKKKKHCLNMLKDYTYTWK
jgi:hypothetical protein